MKCHYAIHRAVVTQTIFGYDEDGRNIINTTTENNMAVFAKCHEEACGAWSKKEGRCIYAGIVE